MYFGRDDGWQYLCLGSAMNQFTKSSLILRISALLSCRVPPSLVSIEPS